VTDPEKDAIDARWNLVRERIGDLCPLFDEIRLSLSQTQVARALALPNVGALRRLLRTRDLPDVRVLRDWYYVVRMVERAHQGDALGHWTMHRGDCADVYYRFVETVTGLPWRVVRDHGVHWVRARALEVWAPYLGEDHSGM